jgi:hypothetical protein
VLEPRVGYDCFEQSLALLHSVLKLNTSQVEEHFFFFVHGPPLLRADKVKELVRPK